MGGGTGKQEGGWGMGLLFLLVSLGYGGGYTTLFIYLNVYKDVPQKGEILLNVNGKEN